MAYIKSAVYTPPVNSGLPLVAVVLLPDGEVLTARTVPSVEAGESLIQDVLTKVGKDAGVPVKKINDRPT
jgi:hypothetical protein